MNLRTLLLTENDCYKTGRKITPKGIMLHSTGANNPNLKRYIGPDDGLLGVNQYGNHWNQPRPDGRQVCIHGFIGKLADGSIASYQTLPWDMRGWHSGSGKKGTANDSYIGIELCEDTLTDGTYFNAVYQEAVELCGMLCKTYGLSPQSVICHSEGAAVGIASNHSDVMHWFPRHGKNMDTFRADVQAALGGTAPIPTPTPAPPTADRGYLKKGDRGDAVKELQQLLNAQGYGLVVDGIFGAKTDSAVRSFQKSRGLTVDGLAGVKTMAALRSIPQAPTLTLGRLLKLTGPVMKGTDVKAVQVALIAKGYSCGPSGADGMYGTRTLAAVKMFQKATRIAQDGIAGPDTIRSLGGSWNG